MKLIENNKDIKLLVTLFYGKLLKDELMAPFFEGIDLVHHFPRIIGFWSFILLDEPYNTGNVFDKHRHLIADERYFDRWIDTFCHTVDELFYGEKAEKAKQNAKIIGFTFMSKLKHLNSNT